MLFGNNIPPHIKNKLLDAHFRALEEEQEALKNEPDDPQNAPDFSR
jgi:hypothetical protein